MSLKISPVFEKYWPSLSQEKLDMLERSILSDGLTENLVVWKERDVLLDGHQRLKILRKHNIPFDDRITALSFPDELAAKYWVHTTQLARRGAVEPFLAIAHVLEFEPIYRAQTKERQRAGGKVTAAKALKTKADKFGASGPEAETGRHRKFMAEDAIVSESSVKRALYIRAHDPKKFEALVKLALSSEVQLDEGGKTKSESAINILAEYSKVKLVVDGKKEGGLAVAAAAVEQLTTRPEIDAFTKAIRESVGVVSPKIQRVVAKKIANDRARKDKRTIHGPVEERAERIKTIIAEEQIQEKLGPRKSRPAKTTEELAAERIESDLEAIFQHCSALRNKIGRVISDLKRLDVRHLGGPAAMIGQYDMAGLARELVALASFFSEKKGEERCQKLLDG